MLEFSCFFLVGFQWFNFFRAGNLFVKINEFFARRIPKIRFELVLLETLGVSPSYSICRTGNAVSIVVGVETRRRFLGKKHGLRLDPEFWCLEHLGDFCRIKRNRTLM